jgi:hypothetical protein
MLHLAESLPRIAQSDVPALNKNGDSPVPVLTKNGDSPVPVLTKNGGSPVPLLTKNGDSPVPVLTKNGDSPVPVQPEFDESLGNRDGLLEVLLVCPLPEQVPSTCPYPKPASDLHNYQNIK